MFCSAHWKKYSISQQCFQNMLIPTYLVAQDWQRLQNLSGSSGILGSCQHLVEFWLQQQQNILKWLYNQYTDKPGCKTNEYKELWCEIFNSQTIYSLSWPFVTIKSLLSQVQKATNDIISRLYFYSFILTSIQELEIQNGKTVFCYLFLSQL